MPIGRINMCNASSLIAAWLAHCTRIIIGIFDISNVECGAFTSIVSITAEIIHAYFILLILAIPQDMIACRALCVMNVDFTFHTNIANIIRTEGIKDNENNVLSNQGQNDAIDKQGFVYFI